MINWKVRLRNKHWVIAFISQIMILAQMVLAGLNTLGVTSFQLTDAVQSTILTIVNAIFVILSMLGFVQDPTTKGYGDSERALNYKDPN
ncbi:phi LC3 family holin [Bacillus sp. SLBN-46]|jgi:phi LC3 family holin|uniref:phage holin n=1 Tax=Bacillus sp. SLBN-46 TaxID=3042283 RepID=UPI002861A53E|nr:phage holin [Bacillus sp. SLBN-46]MDR6123835.1 phi LC3 family holin [Bacillus sp. SLBN-46]